MFGLAEDPGLADPCVVEHHEGPRFNQLDEVGHTPVLPGLLQRVHSHETALSAGFRRFLSDELGRKVEGEVFCLQKRTP
jgi:hypothetical protein